MRLGNSLKPFLWIGATLAILRTDGKKSKVNDILKISVSLQKRSFLSNFSILVVILLGPTQLVESSKDIMRTISSLTAELRKKKF